ncbi:MAG: hypothetical protein QM710_08245 [Flavobacterium sp.]
MKKKLFAIMIFCFQFMGLAQEKKGLNAKDAFISGSIITSLNEETIQYKFKSLDDLNTEMDEIINEFGLENESKKKNDDQIVFKVEVELLSGLEKTNISKSITASRKNESLVMVIQRFRTMLLALTAS